MDGNLKAYRAGETVSSYSGYRTLQPCELFLFDKYVRPGGDILDIGVGAGRTTPYLSGKARRYIGVDYSPEMVEASRSKFPKENFRIVDATDLSCFGDKSFDLVVFAFNGIGEIHPDTARKRCLAEVQRVLRPDGLFIFSIHNSRSAFQRPSRAGAGVLGIVRGAAFSAIANLRRAFRRALTGAFWSGSGYIHTDAHGGLTVFASTPELTKTELVALGFDQLETLNEDYPRPDRRLITRWYYSVARKRRRDL